MTTEFRLRRRVQFYETDLAGFVHFSWFLRYMEEAEHALWREAGLSIAPKEPDLGFPRVAASVEFQAPLYFEDEFEIWIRVAAMSRRTIRYACVITRGDTQVATGTLTAACVRRHAGSMESVDLPASVTSRIGVAEAV